MTFEALKMGSYGAYVWSAYGLTLAGLVCMAVIARRSSRHALAQAQRRMQVASANNAGESA